MALQTAVSESKHKMVLDMAEVGYSSSARLRTLADVVTQNREAGGDLKLVALQPRIVRVLWIISFDKFFSIYDSVDKAAGGF